MLPRELRIALVIWAVAAVSCAGQATSRDYWPTEEWRTAKPSQQGVDSSRLELLDRFIRGNVPRLTSLLIIRHGYIVFERYYVGDKDTLRSLYSITKSCTSCLIGVLIQEHYLESIDAKMIASFPEYQGSDLNLLVNDITIRHLLTMSDGLPESNLVESAVKSSPGDVPGKSFLYREISAQILSVLITKITGIMALDFGKKHLFGPLGISTVSWRERAGHTNGADGLKLTTRDAAKLGYLYLNNGIWNGKQIIPSGWVAESTRKQIEVPEDRGWTREYGLYWWLRDTAGYRSYAAAGFGPQLIYVVPELDLLVVLTTYDETYPGYPYVPLIDERIVPAILK